MKKIQCYLSTALSLMCYCSIANATENGMNHFPSGVNTFMNAMMPPPSQSVFQSYTLYYSSDHLKGSNGQSLDLNFKTRTTAEVFRVMHTWEAKLGPFNMTTYAGFPVMHMDTSIGDKHDSSTGLGDPVIAPLVLSYSNPEGTLRGLWGLDFWVPVGKYDEHSLTNQGLNYWTFGSLAQITWLPKPRWEVSGTFYTSINTKNQDTHYQSGDSITLEGSIGYRPFTTIPALTISAQGWAYNQFNDDELNNTDIPNSRGRAYALGPQIAYDLNKQGAGFLVKWQKEFSVKNRPEGDLIWLQLAVPF